MDLPKNEKVFSVDYVGETTGKRYEGTFTVRCALNIAQKHALELEKTRLLGNYAAPTDGLEGISLVLANLRVKVIDGPEWWKQSGGGYEIMDEDVLVHVYNKIKDSEVEWRTELKAKAQPKPQEPISQQ